jgi:hypothetical protein
MDTVIQSKHLKPGVRRAMKSASLMAETSGVRVVAVKGGFRLQSSETTEPDPSASAGPARNGHRRIGVMAHLGLKLDD